MHMMIVFAYAIGSQAIRHQVMGPSGMYKDVWHETYVVCWLFYSCLWFATL